MIQTEQRETTLNTDSSFKHWTQQSVERVESKASLANKTLHEHTYNMQRQGQPSRSMYMDIIRMSPLLQRLYSGLGLNRKYIVASICIRLNLALVTHIYICFAMLHCQKQVFSNIRHSKVGSYNLI